jgi:SAM-dependent methyltransferase
MVSRALSFGAAAEQYDRYRLGYPESVTELVLAYAQPPVRRALEVGAGTGKATRQFAERGIEVVACEPDPAMAVVLARNTAGLPVRIVESTFEAVDLPEPVDLLVAAASWHWTDPMTRWSHAAELVRPGGTLAFFGAGGTVRTLLADPALQEAADVAKEGLVVEPPFTSEEQSPSGLWWPASEMEGLPEFTDLEQHDVPRTLEHPREDFVGLLGTMSAFLALAETDRAEVLHRIAAVLPPVVSVSSDLRIHLARRTATVP